MMSGLHLYEIANEYRALIDIINDIDPDEIDMDSFTDALNAMQEGFSDKAANIGCLLREIEAEAEAIIEVSKAQRTRGERLERRACWLREYLINQMKISGISSASDRRIRINLRNNPPSVRIDTPEAVPVEYCRMIPQRLEPDKSVIRDALKSGKSVPGVSLVRTNRLEIK